MAPEIEQKTFGRYEVIRPLGRGAMGEVYLARDPELRRLVAIKSLASIEALPPAEQEELRARFRGEARAAAALSHPHLMTIHDVGEHEGVPFMAMEYLEGITLDRHTQNGHLLPPAKVLEIGIQAAAALDVAHRAGIVHRDIKPANLVLLSNGAVKVTDFGLAKAPQTGLRSNDQTVGTPNYMSPEQIAGRPLDGRADLFSLGVSLFELLAGARPFPGDTISSVMYRIVNEPPQSLTALRPGLPTALERLLETMLAKEPNQRLPSGTHVAAAIEPILHQLGGVPSNIELPPPSATHAPSR
ncbi:MAG: serine/threonine protein kinase, partial [Acidobacteriota bacterium]